MSKYIVGIDPGMNGGIVALNNGKIIDIRSMPIGPRAIYEHFLYLGLPKSYKGELSIFIENVHSMPTDGSRAAFTFGKGLGWLEGIFACMGLPEASKVNPKQWMDWFELKRDKEIEEKKYDFKKRIKELAIKLCPKDHQVNITLKTCDAFLIALYGYQSLQAKALALQEAETLRN